MNSLLGTMFLTVGAVAAIAASISWVLTARTQDAGWRRFATLSTWVTLAAALAAFTVLEVALLTHDFSVRFVAENGGRAVPTYFTAISAWSALEGSLLLWLVVLAGYMVAVLAHARRAPSELHPWALAAMSAVAVFFFHLARFVGNPFAAVTPVPPDGPGPNPLLQNHWLMGIHPPLLYLGYVGMTVPFAYAVAALATGRTGHQWVQVVRQWTLLAWTCLTIAIVMGGWWSYEVLGWGGYWAWDPVENASIFPWFTATALVHSMMVQRRRNTLRVWNLVLAAATFLLILIGTFLTRSGVIASVHSFTQSDVGPVLLGFIAVVFVGTGALFVWRSDRLGPDPGVGARLSRETVFLGNNVLLVTLALTVLVGTVFPLLVEAINGQRVSVGAPYFNRTAIPLALAVLVLMGIGPLVPWGRADARALARRLTIPAVTGLAVVGALGTVGLGQPLALLAFGLAAFVLATIALRLAQIAVVPLRRGGRLRGVLVTLARRRRLVGGLIVHTGVVIAAVAIAASSAYSSEKSAKLAVGEQLRVGPYTATLQDIQRQRTSRRMEVVADVVLSRDGRRLGTYQPALRFYPRASQSLGSPAVRTTVAGDAYLTLDSVDPSGRWAVVGLASKPAVVWLWVAPGVMAAGAAIAAWPVRRRDREGRGAADATDRELVEATS